MTELRPLGEIMEALQQVGFETTYAYDDLVFIKHSPFMLRFDINNPRILHFYAHNSFEKDKQQELLEAITAPLEKARFKIENNGTFDLKESESEENNLDISFYDFEVSA